MALLLSALVDPHHPAGVDGVLHRTPAHRIAVLVLLRAELVDHGSRLGDPHARPHCRVHDTGFGRFRSDLGLPAGARQAETRVVGLAFLLGRDDVLEELTYEALGALGHTHAAHF